MQPMLAPPQAAACAISLILCSTVRSCPSFTSPRLVLNRMCVFATTMPPWDVRARSSASAAADAAAFADAFAAAIAAAADAGAEEGSWASTGAACCCCCCCCCGGCCWAVGGIGGSGMAGLRRADGLRNVSRWWRITKRGPAGMRASAKALSFHNMMVLSVNSAFFKLSWYFGYPSVLSMYFPRSYSVSVLSGLKFCPIW
mmetsp:Transcript_8688/g.23323  ORF Transcript_8688/g.23323 Transcript_8688/m.23323 type:complete len:200 (-) Transcript_8688:588-1187(-)